MPTVPLEEMPALVGSETGHSSWFLVDQERVDRFADVTEDRQWIHIDTDAAEAGPFGGTIAHGFLTLSLLPALTTEASLLPADATMYINYGSNKVRFLNPVKVGSRVRAVSTLSDVSEKRPGQVLVTNTVTVEIEGEETPALVAELLTLAVMNPTT